MMDIGRWQIAVLISNRFEAKVLLDLLRNVGVGAAWPLFETANAVDELVRRTPNLLIVADEADGVDLVEWVRQLRRASDHPVHKIPVFVVSSRLTASLAERCRQAGANAIIGNYQKESFAMGINGSWGSGKTSFIDLLKRRLADQPNLICADFDPWRYSDSPSLIRAFFQTVRQTLKPFNDQLPGLFLQYTDTLLNNNGPDTILDGFGIRALQCGPNHCIVGCIPCILLPNIHERAECVAGLHIGKIL